MNTPLEIALIAKRTGFLMAEFGAIRGLYTFTKLWLIANKFILIVAGIVDTAFYLVVLGGISYGIYRLSKRLL